MTVVIFMNTFAVNLSYNTLVKFLWTFI